MLSKLKNFIISNKKDEPIKQTVIIVDETKEQAEEINNLAKKGLLPYNKEAIDALYTNTR